MLSVGTGTEPCGYCWNEHYAHSLSDIAWRVLRYSRLVRERGNYLLSNSTCNVWIQPYIYVWGTACHARNRNLWRAQCSLILSWEKVFINPINTQNLNNFQWKNVSSHFWHNWNLRFLLYFLIAFLYWEKEKYKWKLYFPPSLMSFVLFMNSTIFLLLLYKHLHEYGSDRVSFFYTFFDILMGITCGVIAINSPLACDHHQLFNWPKQKMFDMCVNNNNIDTSVKREKRQFISDTVKPNNLGNIQENEETKMLSM